MAKELFICYDKLCERPTKTLMGLLSQNPEIKAKMFIPKMFPQIASRQYSLHIGQNCTENLVFDDAFNDYGTRIGSNGTVAWIVCTGDYEWNGTKFEEFINELKTLCNKYNLKKEYKEFEYHLDVIRTLFIFGLELWHGNLLERIKDPALDRTSITIKLQDPFSAYESLLTNRKISAKIRDQDTLLRSYQYLYAMLKFYDQYVEDFLGIKEEKI